jgi:hypothetical protein
MITKKGFEIEIEKFMIHRCLIKKCCYFFIFADHCSAPQIPKQEKENKAERESCHKS